VNAAEFDARVTLARGEGLNLPQSVVDLMKQTDDPLAKLREYVTVERERVTRIKGKVPTPASSAVPVDEAEDATPPALTTEPATSTADAWERKTGLKLTADAATAMHEGAKAGHRTVADHEGVSWRPIFDGPVNKHVYPTYSRVPPYIPPLVPLMNGTERGTVIAIVSRADHNGDFIMPKGLLADLIGSTRRLAEQALATLEEATVIAVKYQGARKQATVWRLVKVAEHDPAKAGEAFERRRVASSQEARERLPLAPAEDDSLAPSSAA